ncbi:hypothetical protein GCM10023216_07490 [Isoptericola chiayiensis]|uniref:Lipoprotein n=1 Tax=Isoptericola chiayiensis TaxID=579446 RepID=A0ABP8Y334_9MICO|nr:hypothetical protein [Isoptericola chiayiensis]NOV99291.1 hypothetical protein [Isoptericola chiayiensis]
MRSTLPRAGAAATTLLLALGLAACSGGADDAEAQAFCDSFDALEDLTTELGEVDYSDPEAATSSLEQITAEIESIEAPEEIADDYAVVSSAFRTFTDTASEALADPENVDQQAMSEATAAMGGEEFTAATTALNDYTNEHCAGASPTSE